MKYPRLLPQPSNTTLRTLRTPRYLNGAVSIPPGSPTRAANTTITWSITLSYFGSGWATICSVGPIEMRGDWPNEFYTINVYLGWAKLARPEILPTWRCNVTRKYDGWIECLLWAIVNWSSSEALWLDQYRSCRFLSQLVKKRARGVFENKEKLVKFYSK